MTSKTVFNKEKIDFTKQPMFFGEAQNVQRYDIFKFPVILHSLLPLIMISPNPSDNLSSIRLVRESISLLFFS